MLRSILFALTFSLLGAVPVSAQTVQQSQHLSDYLGTQTTGLNQLAANLLSMTAGLPDSEDRAGIAIHDAVAKAEVILSTLYTLATIHGLMVDARDQATAKNYVSAHAKFAMKRLDITLRIIESDLVRMRSPAFIAEAQRARDQIVRIKNEIERLVPPG
jgi:hypothetical protein